MYMHTYIHTYTYFHVLFIIHISTYTCTSTYVFIHVYSHKNTQVHTDFGEINQQIFISLKKRELKTIKTYEASWTLKLTCVFYQSA